MCQYERPKSRRTFCFENDTLLGNVIKSGTVLNAKASRELVENIFYPKSPLHDGAMVIRDGKIYAAGCILPLTKKTVSSLTITAKASLSSVRPIPAI